MALTKIKLGKLITVSNIKNDDNFDLPFYGINRNKEFMPTVADTNELDKRKYKIITKGRFVFSGMQTGRDQCIRIGMYQYDFDALISPAYTTFEVTSAEILSEYMFMLFKSSEMDRYGAFLSDGSIRSNLDWNVFCDIEIDLPPIEIQRKYVAVYKSMVANQQAYEQGLDELKLTCDAYIENLRKVYPCEKIGKYIHLELNKNKEYSINKNMAVSADKIFVPSHAELLDVDIGNYLICRKNQFAYNTVTTRNADKISIAYNTDTDCLVSPIYTVFSVERIVPEYLMLWFKRDEFDRYARYNSWGSAREMFTFDDLRQFSIPLPSVEVQKAIANIYKSFMERSQINKTLSLQIKDLCPILIKGATEEAIL